MKRMRLVGWKVQPVVMVDDGENLTGLEVAAIGVPATEWQAFKDGGDIKALEGLRAQIETAPNGVTKTGAKEAVKNRS